MLHTSRSKTYVVPGLACVLALAIVILGCGGGGAAVAGTNSTGSTGSNSTTGTSTSSTGTASSTTTSSTTGSTTSTTGTSTGTTGSTTTSSTTGSTSTTTGSTTGSTGTTGSSTTTTGTTTGTTGTTGGLLTSDWPKFNGDLLNTGRISTSSSCGGSLDWQYNSNYSFNYNIPTIGSDGTIYAGILGGGPLQAINPNGTLKWSYPLNTDTQSSALSSDGTIYAGSIDGYLYAINSDGTLKWRTKLYDGNYSLRYSSPTIGSDGTIYIGLGFQGDFGELVALNPNGSIKWTYSSTSRVRGCPAIGSDGTIYISTVAGESGFNRSLGGVHAVSPNGTRKWIFTNISLYDKYGSPSVGQDGTIYVASGNGIYAISPQGAQKWNYVNAWNYDCSTTNMTPAIANDGSVVVVGVIGFDASTGKRVGGVVCLNSNGTTKWFYQSDGEASGSTPSPIIDGQGNIYAPGLSPYTQNMYSLTANGNLRWSFTCGQSTSAAISSNGKVYFSDSGGRLFSLR